MEAKKKTIKHSRKTTPKMGEKCKFKPFPKGTYKELVKDPFSLELNAKPSYI